MSIEHRTEGLFSLLPPGEREDIYWRIAAGFDELYDSMKRAFEDLQSLETELSVIFRGDGCSR